MSARITKAEFAYLMPSAPSPAEERLAALREEAARAQAEAIKAGLRRFFARLTGWLERVRAKAALRALSSRELADLGLSRGEISGAVGGRWR
jgi:uncharacterized protein YjiS (DUF1127 family)